MSKPDVISSEYLHRDDVTLLLKLASQAEQQNAMVAQQREAFLKALVEAVGGRGAFWGWGRGRPGISTVAPVAAIPIGFSTEAWANIAQFCLSEEGQRLTQMPIFARLQQTQHATVRRIDLVDDQTWYSSQLVREVMQPAGVDDFVSSVRYFSEDSWHCVNIFAACDRVAFSTRDASLLHAALAGLTLLEPKVSESVPREAFMNVTPRQGMVMLYLLDGVPRKQIASIMGMTLHTVNDHIKALYGRFGVQSATELAAKFLKSV